MGSMEWVLARRGVGGGGILAAGTRVRGSNHVWKPNHTGPMALVHTLHPRRASLIARPVLLAPSLPPRVVGPPPADGRARRREHARHPRHLPRHRVWPHVHAHRPRPVPARRLSHPLGVGAVAKVRVLGRLGQALRLELEPALAKLVHVDVKGEAARRGAKGPDLARTPLPASAEHRRPAAVLARARGAVGFGGPPLLPLGAGAAADARVRLAGGAALGRASQVEAWLAETPDERSVARVAGVGAGVAGCVRHITLAAGHRVDVQHSFQRLQPLVKIVVGSGGRGG
mmetsp:Transcript_46469/g.149788  ORF Transcript_46469/g.149788 Transcript_46469/m.149788 type:complete len:286 (-) Transcript_46469:270-1127(-)